VEQNEEGWRTRGGSAMQLEAFSKNGVLVAGRGDGLGVTEVESRSG
jgi:hypothetical protein